ncbi:MAG TPA: recombinase family protein [Terriglobia bacterium]|nr:recombinase family protein [Terriglobia bacterium]
MKAALYARVSTRDQSCEMQVRELEEYCERRGWEIYGPRPLATGLVCQAQTPTEYRDLAMSGATKSRPALDALMSDARLKKFDVVVVYRYDRFARSLHHLVSAFEEFRSLGIDFVSLHEQIDTTTPNGRLVFGIMASIAEFERELIRERVRSGIAAAKSKGKQMGRPKRVFDRERIAALRSQGISWRQIEAETKIPIPTLIRTLKGVPKTPFRNFGTGADSKADAG